MSYKSAALKSLSAAGIMYLFVMGIYGSLVISSSQLRDPGVMQTDVYTGERKLVPRGRTGTYRSVSMGGPLPMETEVGGSPSPPGRGMESRTPSLYGSGLSPEVKTTYSLSASRPSVLGGLSPSPGEKRSSSEVQSAPALSQAKTQVTQVAKAVRSGSQLGLAAKSLSQKLPGEPGAVLSRTTQQMIKAESTETGLSQDGLN